MRVKELSFTPGMLGGHRAVIMFANGYGASIITGGGGIDRLFEIAVLKNGRITYDTHITDTVCGFLTEKEADAILKAIEAL